jgi:hypothetical protein
VTVALIKYPDNISMDPTALLFGMEDDEPVIQGNALYEELNPDFEDINGGLKTNNPAGNRYVTLVFTCGG